LENNWQTRKNSQGDENYTWCSLDEVEKEIYPGDFRVVLSRRQLRVWYITIISRYLLLSA